jgi:hypothetical protein
VAPCESRVLLACGLIIRCPAKFAKENAIAKNRHQSYTNAQPEATVVIEVLPLSNAGNSRHLSDR